MTDITPAPAHQTPALVSRQAGGVAPAGAAPGPSRRLQAREHHDGRDHCQGLPTSSPSPTGPGSGAMVRACREPCSWPWTTPSATACL